jgi:hypothetical protein
MEGPERRMYSRLMSASAVVLLDNIDLALGLLRPLLHADIVIVMIGTIVTVAAKPELN